mmetsp:Transcript_5942/g.8558  ORF Transcript_5942/g.8558 Transcript_5942/m.8558 type:complete len:87 (+) Transcript_5942:238-498(+)
MNIQHHHRLQNVQRTGYSVREKCVVAQDTVTKTKISAKLINLKPAVEEQSIQTTLVRHHGTTGEGFICFRRVNNFSQKSSVINHKS